MSPHSYRNLVQVYEVSLAPARNTGGCDRRLEVRAAGPTDRRGLVYHKADLYRVGPSGQGTRSAHGGWHGGQQRVGLSGPWPGVTSAGALVPGAPACARRGQCSVAQVPMGASVPCSPSLVGSSDRAPATAKTSSSLITALAPATDRDCSICVGSPDCWCSPDSPR